MMLVVVVVAVAVVGWCSGGRGPAGRVHCIGTNGLHDASKKAM